MAKEVMVIGSGPAGYVCAIKAAQLGLQTTLVERYPTLGGTCLNVGCIPSKALLHHTHLYTAVDQVPSLANVMDKKTAAVNRLTQGVQFLCKKNKVRVLTGMAQFVNPTTVQVGSQTYTPENIVLATGSEPVPLGFLPFEGETVVSSTGALTLKGVPKTLLVIGGGVIGLELGSVYQRLGSQVHVIELMDRIVPEFDTELSQGLKEALVQEGIEFHLSSKVLSGKKTSDGVELEIETAHQKRTLRGEVCLVSIGRRPRTEGLDLEKANVACTEKGFIHINDTFQTSQPHIYAIGDVAGPPLLAHKGSEEGIAVAELLSGHTPYPISYITIPNVIYTMPEAASVGLTEEALKRDSIPYKKAVFPLLANSRYAALAAEEPGFFKLLTQKVPPHHILGCHILAPHAGDLIMEAVLCMRHKLNVEHLIQASHAHPTYSEAMHEVAMGIQDKFIHY